MSHLDHLRTFIEAYRLASFSKAAEQLGMTQPAASLHIQSLEALVGKPLFVRQPRGVLATDAAHELARAVGPMLDGLETRLASYRAGGALSGTVHLAGPADFIAQKLAHGLAPLLRLGLRLRVHTGNRQRIYGLLGDDTADLAITASLPDERVHGYSRLLTENYQLVLAPAMMAELGKKPDPARLTGLPLLAYDEDLPLIRPVWNTLFRVPPPLQAALTIPDLRVIQDMVQSGQGWSVLPDYQCAAAIAAGRLLSLASKGTPPNNHLYLAWNKSALRNPATVHVRDFILALFDQAQSVGFKTIKK